MRVEARDTGKAWNPGTVTCVKPLRVKLDSELSGCGWDEVRPLTHEPEKPKTGVDLIKQKIMEDAQALVNEAKDAALEELKKAVEGFRDISSQEVPNPEALKEAKTKVAAAIKEAQAKGVSPEELIEASSQMSAPKPAAQESVKEEAVKGEKVKKEKVKKEKVVIEFANPAVGEAAKQAAEKAKEEGKPLPEMIKSAIAALQTVGGASPEDIKKVKKLAAEIALDKSDSSDSSDDSGSETEEEREIDKDEKAKAKREGIAAAFYFNAK